MAAKSDGFKDFVLDQLADLRGVTARAMFGGYGLYRSVTFFGIVHQDRLKSQQPPHLVTRHRA
jgi:DNA transformation protein